MCNYSYLHKKCPAATRKTKEILPGYIVYDILNTLGKYEYGTGKSISFNIYNDSLNDPRLFEFIKYSSSKCPKANIIIGTNGWYLTEDMVKELYSSGTTYILVSSYSREEYINLCQLRKNITSFSKEYPTVSFGIRQIKKLDDRLTMTGEGGRCYAPLTEIPIYPNGKVGLCCLDINQENSYGDLAKIRFENLITQEYERLLKLRSELIKSVRNLQICKKCSFVNRWKTAYDKKEDDRGKRDLLRKFL
jgi:MoaA/NifB/PqqE/SkfB family radical SAM enzyme